MHIVHERKKAHLCDSDHEQTIGLLGVIAGELAEHLSQTSIIGSSPYKSHSKDSIDGNGEVIVVGVARESVENGENGVGSTEQS